MSPPALSNRDKFLSAAAFIAAEVIAGRVRSAESVYAALPPEHQAAIAARVTYDLHRLAGKDVTRGWLDLLFSYAGAPPEGERTVHAALETADVADLARMTRHRKA